MAGLLGRIKSRENSASPKGRKKREVPRIYVTPPVLGDDEKSPAVRDHHSPLSAPNDEVRSILLPPISILIADRSRSLQLLAVFKRQAFSSS